MSRACGCRLLLLAWFMVSFVQKGIAEPVQQAELTASPRAAGALKSAESPRADSPKTVELFNGKDLKPWKVAVEGDFSEHGKVEVVDGAIHVGAGNSGSGIVWHGHDLPKVNYEIQLEAKRTAGRDFFCGLTFPIEDAHCTWILGGWGGGAVGLTAINGTSAVENSTTSFWRFEENRWYRLRLRVTPETVTGWIDEEEVFKVESLGLEYSVWVQQGPMKPLGLASWETAAAWRNLKLIVLEPDVEDSPKPRAE